jgi:alcohol dehydrogenase YqhD (iron-dependent ADH family)
MRDFTFISPTRLVVGRDAESQTGRWIKEFGGNRVLVHHDSGYAKESGLVDKVIQNIKDEGLTVFELGGVVPNPRLSLIRKGVDFSKDNNIDFIVAIGGGSVIDSAKGIALGAPYENDVWDFYIEEGGVTKAVPTKSRPVGVVLTMPASGSEGGNSTVVTKEDENLKRFVDSDYNRPVFAIENPELTMSLSRFQTACGILDIMSHSFERYFTRDKGNEFTDRLCEAIFFTCLNCGRILIEEPDNYDARASIMVSAMFSHNGMTGMGRQDDWAVHMIEHELSGEFDVTHGIGLAVLIPAWMKYVCAEKGAQDIFVKFATRVFGVEYDYDRPELTIKEGIERLEAFIRKLGLKTHMSEVDALSVVTEESMWKMARRVRVTNDVGTTGWLKKLTHEDIVNIFKLAK